VALTGFLPDCQVFDEVRRARALVHAAWHESFGLSLLEAMYLGTPVVTTAAEGPRRIVEDGVTGFVVPVGDAEALSSRMLDLSGNADLARRLGDAARRTVARRFPPQDTFDDFVRACRRIGLMP
jgi:glycosyltransferase involved in cell wall biosynthesis